MIRDDEHIIAFLLLKPMNSPKTYPPLHLQVQSMLLSTQHKEGLELNALLSSPDFQVSPPAY